MSLFTAGGSSVCVRHSRPRKEIENAIENALFCRDARHSNRDTGSRRSGRTSHAVKAAVVGRGPAIIFIPGLNSSGVVWDAIVKGLEDRYTCHILTLAGFAGEPAIDPPYLPTIRDAVLRYIQERRLGQPVIVGHSLGGVLALWLGATAESHVGSIVTIDGVPFFPGLTNPAATAESVRPMAIRMRDVFLCVG